MNNDPLEERQMDEPELARARERVAASKNPQSELEQLGQRGARSERAQSMETLGLLAAGVAHDINNVLSIILGEVGLLQSDVPRGSRAEKSLEKVSAAAESAARFLRQLLSFSRRQEVGFRPLDLNAVLGNLEILLSRSIDKRIVLEMRRAAPLPHVEADLGMIEQLVMNLALNSRDAMPDGGTLQITSTVVEVDAAHLGRHSGARMGTFVCLEVADTGCGIDHEILGLIFEPFFSTKGSGQGSGLGLATADSIARRHHGWIEVESTVGAGSVFRVFLPAATLQPTQLDKTEVQLQLLHTGQETILLVEDDSDLRKAIGAVLRSYGYQVLEAGCEPEALRIWDAYHGKIDLLLIDLVMPGGMNGHELALNLKRRRPDLKVIYSSGYSVDVIESIAGNTEVVFLQKPYLSGQLAKTVRQCLDTLPKPQANVISA